jgi:hypothetical protein
MRTFAGSWLRIACCFAVLSGSLTACGGGGGDASTSAQTSGAAQTPAAPSSSGNSAPTVTGSASASASVGQAYSFKPTAADADKDAVTFTIANKPSWATFNAATGLLSGTPAAADVGEYTGIEIAATDGKDVTPLPEFTITVDTEAVSGSKSVALSWTPPTQNADGSTLTDLSGYKIHYGAAPKSYSNSVAVNTAGITSYQVDDLPPGKLYFAMTSVNAAGAESDFSPEVVVTVN